MQLINLNTSQINTIMERMSKDIPQNSIAYFQRTRVMGQRLIEAWEERIFGGSNVKH